MTIFRTFLDLSINGGWNGVAIGFYAIVATLALTAYIERRSKNR